jgi:hypothetical protein
MNSEMATTLASSLTWRSKTMCITSWITVLSWSLGSLRHRGTGEIHVLITAQDVDLTDETDSQFHTASTAPLIPDHAPPAARLLAQIAEAG